MGRSQQTSRSRRDHLVADNLTRDEARTRAELISVDSYQVELDVTGGDSDLPFGIDDSISTARGPGRRPSSTSWHPKVHAITLNGAPVSLDAFDGERIALDGLRRRSNELVVDAECAYSRSGEGLHRFADPADGNVYMYSDLETFDAHRIYACFDQPDMKAAYELTVRAPRGLARGVQHGARHRGRRPRPSRRHAAVALPADAGDVDLHHARVGRPVAHRARRARRHPARHLLPPVAGQVPGPRRDLRGHQAGLRLLPRRRSASSTRSASTTSSSCPSSRKARWRTPAPSPSSRTTCSGRGSPTSPVRRAARRSCTRWRTCGSATWSPCAGGTTCG